ncbi:hypothetical protein HMPREF9319_1744 [Streptococcus equinus ATCC 700338]|uniref:Uncharacterized protein n=1 Tax=Streptococcus equinus ATCC 700338 TaxID=864569 RepID=E0PFX1_STREI|nr:hypothetical protein HMPREF9319_1744 [Streptococcus equinus ATCC 700338]
MFEKENFRLEDILLDLTIDSEKIVEKNYIRATIRITSETE